VRIAGDVVGDAEGDVEGEDDATAPDDAIAPDDATAPAEGTTTPAEGTTSPADTAGIAGADGRRPGENDAAGGKEAPGVALGRDGGTEDGARLWSVTSDGAASPAPEAAGVPGTSAPPGSSGPRGGADIASGSIALVAGGAARYDCAG